MTKANLPHGRGVKTRFSRDASSGLILPPEKSAHLRLASHSLGRGHNQQKLSDFTADERVSPQPVLHFTLEVSLPLLAYVGAVALPNFCRR